MVHHSIGSYEYIAVGSWSRVTSVVERILRSTLTVLVRSDRDQIPSFHLVLLRGLSDGASLIMTAPFSFVDL